MNWLTENLGTIIVALVLLFIVILIITKMIRDKKNQRGGCGCGCSGCQSKCDRYSE